MQLCAANWRDHRDVTGTRELSVAAAAAALGLIGTRDVARLAVPRSEATLPSVANQHQAPL